MDQSDLNDLVSSFKEVNKTLRKRAITIGILMFLSIGLTYMEYSRLNGVYDLLIYQEKLEKINELDTTAFKKVIDEDGLEYFHWDDRCSSCYEHTTLFRKIKAENYSKTIFVNAIERIDEQIDQLNKDKYFNIVGFSISLEPINYVFFLFMLVLFHDFTQLLLYRDDIYRKIKRLHVPTWKLGFELFGSYTPVSNSSSIFVRFISSVITSLFILCPFITGILMISLRTNVDNILLDIVNLACFVFIIIDTLIIFYNRSRKFRFWGNFLLGNYNTSLPFLKKVWLIILCAFTIILMDESFLSTKADFGVKLFYFIMNLSPFISLFFVLVKCYHSPNKFWQGVRSGLMILSFTWLCLIITRTNYNNFFSQSNLEDLFGAFILISFVSGLIALFYIRFFQVNKSKTHKQSL